MSRSLVTLLALVVVLATGCGEIGLQDLGASDSSPTATSTSELRDVSDSFSDVTALAMRDAKIKLDTSGESGPTLEELSDLDLGRVAIALTAHDVDGEDLEAQIVGALDDDRMLAQPVELPRGPATWLLWTTDGVAFGALFAADSAALIGTAHKEL